MNRVLFGMLLIMATTFLGCEKTVTTDTQKVSYAIGQQIGHQIKSEGIEIDADVLAMSIKDVVKGKESRVSMAELQSAMQKMQQSAQAKNQAAGNENKVAGEKFLESNKSNEGVKVTPSGLQYKVLTEGKGKSPTEKSIVKVHYRGTLLDGTEFDSSYKRNQPAEFPLGGVIKGWTEGLQHMKPGAKYKFWIPGDLAYGPSGRPGIPPNSMLTFEVELLSVK